MDILSYRGPGMAGGVSAGLARVWSRQQKDGAQWWYRAGDHLEALSAQGNTSVIADIPQTVIEGHYRYCNSFLWPLMHDLPDKATYAAIERYFYRQFNFIFAQSLRPLDNPAVCRFVQDYQLALLPGLLNVYSNNRTLAFWHIPWPKHVHHLHVPPLVEVARGLLGAAAVGFHTEEYGENFMRFVARFVPGCYLDIHAKVIRRPAHLHNASGFPWVSLAQTVSGDEQRLARARSAMQSRLSYGKSLSAHAPEETRVMVAPLGIDLDNWSELSESQSSNAYAFDPETTICLSVDRADYTKAVAQRIQCIDRYFAGFPSRRGRLSFVQVCGKTRHDVPVFERYWNECRSAAARVNERWATGNWQPLIWIDNPKTARELAALYRNADMMLVNPVRDGLNLTAKEYVACQSDRLAGVLLLSRGAGVWNELQPYALEVDPSSPDQMVNSIERAMTMSQVERTARMQLMKRRLQANTIHEWWQKFAQHEEMQTFSKRISDQQAQIS